MSTDQPPGQPPEEDPFRKKPQEPQPPGGGSPYGTPPGSQGPPPGGPGSGSPYGDSGAGPPPPYDPYGGGGGFGAPDPLSGMPPLADIGKRLLARIVDFLIVAVPLALIQLPFSTSRWTMDKDEDAGEVFVDAYSGTGLIWTLVGIVAFIGYDTLMVKQSGQTLGKKLMKLRVAMLNDGSTPDTSASLMRATVLWLPALLCCPCIWEIVIFITILFDKPFKQGLHDKSAKTVVVSAA